MRSVHKFLITGANGQIGKNLIPKMISRFGANQVISSDLEAKPAFNHPEGVNYRTLDVLNQEKFEDIIRSEKVNYVVHLASILSSLAEKRPDLAKAVNIDSILTCFDLAAKYNMK